jgi:hypothetical protein
MHCLNPGTPVARPADEARAIGAFGTRTLKPYGCVTVSLESSRRNGWVPIMAMTIEEAPYFARMQHNHNAWYHEMTV